MSSLNAKATHIFFSKNISVYAIFDDQNFNDTLTNDIVSFEQLGPEFVCCPKKRSKYIILLQDIKIQQVISTLPKT